MARRSNEKQQSVMVIAVILAAILIGGSVFAVLVGRDSGGGGVSGGSTQSTSAQSSSSLESEVKTLTQQVYANPDDVSVKERLGTAYFNLANQYKQTNDPRTSATFGEAIKNYKEVVDAKPNSKESLGDLATALFYTDQVDAAIDTVQRALKIDPNFAPARMNYAIYLAYGKGDYANGIKELEKVPAGTSQYSQAQSMIQEFKNAMK